MGRKIDPVVTSGFIMGRCPRCHGDFSGLFNTAEIDLRAKTEVELECTNCQHVGKYFFQWPDEMPKITLRHVSNGRALGGNRKKKKKKKFNPLVLPGQLVFDIPDDKGIIQ